LAVAHVWLPLSPPILLLKPHPHMIVDSEFPPQAVRAFGIMMWIKCLLSSFNVTPSITYALCMICVFFVIWMVIDRQPFFSSIVNNKIVFLLGLCVGISFGDVIWLKRQVSKTEDPLQVNDELSTTIYNFVLRILCILSITHLIMIINAIVQYDIMKRVLRFLRRFNKTGGGDIVIGDRLVHPNHKKRGFGEAPEQNQKMFKSKSDPKQFENPKDSARGFQPDFAKAFVPDISIPFFKPVNTSNSIIGENTLTARLNSKTTARSTHSHTSIPSSKESTSDSYSSSSQPSDHRIIRDTIPIVSISDGKVSPSPGLFDPSVLMQIPNLLVARESPSGDSSTSSSEQEAGINYISIPTPNPSDVASRSDISHSSSLMKGEETRSNIATRSVAISKDSLSSSNSSYSSSPESSSSDIERLIEEKWMVPTHSLHSCHCNPLSPPLSHSFSSPHCSFCPTKPSISMQCSHSPIVMHIHTDTEVGPRIEKWRKLMRTKYGMGEKEWEWRWKNASIPHPRNNTFPRQLNIQKRSSLGSDQLSISSKGKQSITHEVYPSHSHSSHSVHQQPFSAEFREGISSDLRNSDR
ncbi:hypothetical protein ADUPG1_000352, partial [Aduncisulcus paluster]